MICCAAPDAGRARDLITGPGLNVIIRTCCGVAQVDPLPDDAALAAIYARQYYDSWNLHDGGQATRRLKLSTFRRLLAFVSPWLEPETAVLDLGCATGYFLEAAVEAGFQPFGVDVMRHAIDACEARFGSGRFFCGQFEDARFAANPNACFGSIFMSDYLEHVRDPRAVLAAAAKSLTPNGVLVITTPNVAHLSRRLLGRHWPHFKREHLWYFSRSSLNRLLAEAGMTIVAARSTHKVLSLAYLSSQFRRYPMPVVTQVTDTLVRFLPGKFVNAQFLLPTGEITVVAIRA